MGKTKKLSEFRKHFLIAAFLLFACLPIMADDDWTTVENNTAGQLSTNVGDNNLTITKLKVSGSINGADLLCLRKMAGRDGGGNTTGGKLTELDLSGASFVASDDVYFKYTDKTSSTTTEYKITANNELGANAFKQCTRLKSVTLPSNLTGIGNEAFRGCSGMETFTIPDGVTTIGSNAFNSCTALTSVTIPSNVTSIGTRAFQGCSGLTSVTICSGAIDERAFQGCKALTSLEFGNGVTSKSNSFNECTALASVTIKGTSISAGAFNGVDLTSVWVIVPLNAVGGLSTKIGTDYELKIYKLKVAGSINGADLLCLRKMAKRDINGNQTNGHLTDLDLSGASFVQDASNAYYTSTDKSGNTTSYFITDNDVLGDYAFLSCSNLKNVTLPSNLTKIGDEAFRGCSGMETFTVPDGVTTIGYYAFNSCTALTSVEFGNSVPSIGEKAFLGCTGLTSVKIGGGTIGKQAFYNCTALTTVTFGDGELTVGDYAFYNQTSLTTLTFGKGKTSIGEHAFSGCTGLTTLDMSNYVGSIGSNAFSGCSNLATLKLGKGVTSIGDFAFSNCKELPSVTIDDECAASIGASAFYNCSKLASVTLGKVTSIGDKAFLSTALTTISIPGSVKSIGTQAFSGLSSLETVTMGEGVEEIGKNAFYNCINLTDIKIPNTVTIIGEQAFASCSKLATATIGSAVTTIGDKAFQSTALTSVTIGGGVNSIGSNAFRDCTSLADVTILGNMSTIGETAFYNCSSLSKVTLLCSALPTTCATSAFEKITANATLYCKRVLLESCKATEPWKNFNIAVQPFSLTITDAGIATGCFDDDLDFSGLTDVNAYIASGFNPKTGKVLMTRVTEVPKETGFIVKGNAGTYEVPASETNYVYSNMLVGTLQTITLEKTTGDKSNYVLSKVDGNVGFYTPNAKYPLAANKAYLQIPTKLVSDVSGAKTSLGLSFDDEDDTTDISAIQELNDVVNGGTTIYNLNGQRMQNLSKGLNIVNGKKIFIK